MPDIYYVTLPYAHYVFFHGMPTPLSYAAVDLRYAPTPAPEPPHAILLMLRAAYLMLQRRDAVSRCYARARKMRDAIMLRYASAVMLICRHLLFIASLMFSFSCRATAATFRHFAAFHAFFAAAQLPRAYAMLFTRSFRDYYRL